MLKRILLSTALIFAACDGSVDSDDGAFADARTPDATVIPDAGAPDAIPIGSEGGECYPAYFNDAGTQIEERCNGGFNCDDDLCVKCGAPGEECCRVGLGLFCESSSCSNFTGKCL